MTEAGREPRFIGKPADVAKQLGALTRKRIVFGIVNPEHPDDPKKDETVSGFNLGVTKRFRGIPGGEESQTIEVLNLIQDGHMLFFPVSAVRPYSAKEQPS